MNRLGCLHNEIFDKVYWKWHILKCSFTVMGNIISKWIWWSDVIYKNTLFHVMHVAAYISLLAFVICRSTPVSSMKTPHQRLVSSRSWSISLNTSPIRTTHPPVQLLVEMVWVSKRCFMPSVAALTVTHGQTECNGHGPVLKSSTRTSCCYR